MAYYATPANHLATRSGRVKVNPGIVQAVIDAAQVLFESAQFMKTNERLCTQIARIATELATCLELSSQLAFDRQRDLVITPGSASVLGVTREVLLQCSIYMRQASARNILDRVLKHKETSAALNSFHAACLRLRDLVVVPQNGSGKLSLLDDHEHTHHLSLVAFIPKSALECVIPSSATSPS
ncbi:hypothetical protein BKA62DRAFT_153120 [Auriculariales sp. MPI-PUGE-AT-0066]|nr:hypothetical protein BKA62DRAFT_153120 [Auriculariales sp. MPI-PUGE-AT-0066]